MTYNQVIKYYGRQCDIVKKFGPSKQTVNNWGKRNWVPKKWQRKFFEDSGGTLKLSKGLM